MRTLPCAGNPPCLGCPSLLTGAVSAAADHIALGLGGGAAQPVLRGEPALED